ncbi:protein phosphatase 1 regulatory subunit 14B [Daktulosphaira vitifoliae]|uniref:protein phosphatase 1 regulatory subunit 14B n=1 Tax=Daktulosphaira vitifoliae TaxID=58002 RepID=UPI0021AAEBA7|nr:protein phosphatase 1 regulatory subunit 14B [Daktulosphaira vitifoliae]XP_050548667.1 protein phosphatase 1 regulatory subunit 14B [Daktulosphaira vitifoliae]XP_050548668.1 protein phosphatase 1 regulatory subunit 14B [Daktulosphaira vitifoliae]
MECSLASTYANGTTKPSKSISENRSPAKSGLHVNFTEKVEVKEKREKFLTAKYGAHQMSLIRKRLNVEMWLLEELQKLYDLPIRDPAVEGIECEVEIDIDDLLDMENDCQRTQFLQELLSNAKSKENVKVFIDRLLEKIKTL